MTVGADADDDKSGGRSSEGSDGTGSQHAVNVQSNARITVLKAIGRAGSDSKLMRIGSNAKETERISGRGKALATANMAGVQRQAFNAIPEHMPTVVSKADNIKGNSALFQLVMAPVQGKSIFLNTSGEYKESMKNHPNGELMALCSDSELEKVSQRLLSPCSEKDSYVYREHNTKVQLCRLYTPDGTKPFCNERSTFPVRQGAHENDKWVDIIGKVEHYLDVHSLLMIRQTCLALYFHKYTINPRNRLCFRGFVGYDSNIVISEVMPLLMRVLGLDNNVKLGLDFSQCYNFKNISMVYMLTAQAKLHEQMDIQLYCRNVRELVLDYCHHLTDKSLEVMLTCKLPNLERLSLVGCRNENLVGTPFISGLFAERWPKFAKFNCSFSNIGLEPIQAIAKFIIRSEAFTAQTGILNPHLSTKGVKSSHYRSGPFTSCLESDPLSGSSERLPSPKAVDVPAPSDPDALYQFEICGSWGSRMFLDRLGYGPDLCAFSAAIKMRNTKLCSRLTKRIQKGVEERNHTDEVMDNGCLQLLKHRGSELLVNCPIIEQGNQNPIDIWTLPISLAIQNDDLDMFNLLIRRGARVNVWDHCGRSPLYIACESEVDRFVTMLLKLGQAPEPVDDRGFSPLAVCIQKNKANYVEQLLEAGFQLNLRCPHIRNYKSPLYLACMANSDACINMLLERGANPNWLYHGRITPTIVAYQNNPKWLPIFLKYGAGRAPWQRFVLTDVMSYAITKNDVKAISVLLHMYPDLIDREQKVWSKPIIQAARLGKYEIVQFLIEKNVDVNQVGSSKTTALHAAAEENRLQCIRLLVEHNAQLNVQDDLGRTPLYLAVTENRRGAVEILLQSGCDPNIGDSATGETPLMAALRNRNDNIAYIIINQAQELQYDILDKLGRSCCIYCLYFEQYDVGQVILARYIAHRLQCSATEVRWFNAIANERLKSSTATRRSLKRYVRHFRRVNYRVIKENSQLQAQSPRWPLMQSLLERIRWPRLYSDRSQTNNY